MHWTQEDHMVGETVLFYSSERVGPVPAIVVGTETADDGSQELTLIVLEAEIDVLVGHDDSGEPVYGDRATARPVRVPRGQPGKDSGSFWAPRA